MGGTCSHRSGEEINQIKKAARKSTGQPYIHLPFSEYSCTRSSGPLPAAVKEIKSERIKSCAHHHNDAKIVKSEENVPKKFNEYTKIADEHSFKPPQGFH